MYGWAFVLTMLKEDEKADGSKLSVQAEMMRLLNLAWRFLELWLFLPKMLIGMVTWFASEFSLGSKRKKGKGKEKKLE